jgi:GT2 family glycosyltransferase
MKYSVILACHNRKVLTVRSIRQAQASADAAGIGIDFTVFDDGSTDGTAHALTQLPSKITILAGDGSAYWAKGMAQAEESVLSAGGSDAAHFVVWLNDDVQLDVDAFTRLRLLADQEPSAIIAGAMRDPKDDSVTYSGLSRGGAHPLNFSRVFPGPDAQHVHTFNGNLVLVPLKAALLLGGIDGSFSHALADIDYGLRAARLGIPVILAAGTFGTCALNPLPPVRSIRQDWFSFRGHKGGGNFASLRRILRKSNPHTWLGFVAITYGLWWARRIARIGKRTALS